ncbi:MAG: aldehyde ferredoxin oxidoreductase C-terminal domain-containing protein, partial [Candidatus Desulforudaceae bacterium]
ALLLERLLFGAGREQPGDDQQHHYGVSVELEIFIACPVVEKAVGSSRYGVYSKSPLTGFYAESTSGGRVAFPMRRTGYDAMVIEGASETSVFLEISENRLTIFSTQILCVFFRDLIPWEDLVDLNRALTGLDYTKEDLWEVANRVIDLTRKFNLQEGLTREDDSLPPRLFKEKINEGNDGITRDELNCMVDDYYRIRGWQ